MDRLGLATGSLCSFPRLAERRVQRRDEAKATPAPPLPPLRHRSKSDPSSAAIRCMRRRPASETAGEILGGVFDALGRRLRRGAARQAPRAGRQRRDRPLILRSRAVGSGARPKDGPLDQRHVCTLRNSVSGVVPDQLKRKKQQGAVSRRKISGRLSRSTTETIRLYFL